MLDLMFCLFSKAATKRYIPVCIFWPVQQISTLARRKLVPRRTNVERSPCDDARDTSYSLNIVVVVVVVVVDVVVVIDVDGSILHLDLLDELREVGADAPC